MKKHSRGRLLGVIITALWLIAGQAADAQNRPPAAQKSKIVAGFGYVTAGVEAGCLMLQDSKTKTLYNLLFVGKKKPPLGTAIRFTATRHEGPTTCMQGEALDVKTWTAIKLQHPPGQ